MSKSAVPVEIYLQPGDFHFGDETGRLHTVLGSCVSITLWHPDLHIGGMCHFMLPSRGKKGVLAPDGRYGDEAIELFLREIGKFGTPPGEYQAKLFGGGNMFPQLTGNKASEVGVRNVEAARSLLLANGFRLRSEDAGGCGHRRVIFDLRDGHVWVRHEKIKFKHMVASNSAGAAPTTMPRFGA